MSEKVDEDEADPNGSQPPVGRANPLFFGVSAVIVAAGVAAGFAGTAKPAAALHSNIVFRVEVAVAVAAVLYAGVAALWLAWHEMTFKRIGGGAASLDMPQKREQITARDAEITEFMATTTEATDRANEEFEKINARLDALEAA